VKIKDWSDIHAAAVLIKTVGKLEMNLREELKNLD
jgi:hypothetical protein